MRVLKRDLSYEDISFDKVLRRIRTLCDGLKGVRADEIAQQVCARIYDGVRTSELDELAAQLCASMLTTHPDYGTLAARIIISNHHKNTSPSFSETISMMWEATDTNGKRNPLITEDLWNVVVNNRDKLNSIIDYQRDYDISYFGFKTLERSYLSKVNGKIVERPQHMWMRVALGIHGHDIKEAIETYNGLSQRRFIHATPTLFNAGTPNGNLSSCFLLGVHDSISGIYKCLTDCALISKTAGGIGVHIHNIRSRNSYIRGTNGKSSGIIPMLKVFNETAKYVNQCFRGDTFVYTSEGPKQMQNIKIGDLLVTVDGSFKPVLEIARNHVNKKILKIRNKFAINDTYVTKEHEIFVIRKSQCDLSESLDKQLINPGYVNAGSLKVGDYVSYTIPTLIKDYADIDTEYLRFYGIILGCGKCTTTNYTTFSISFNANTQISDIGFVCAYLTKKNIEYKSTFSDAKLHISWIYNKDLLNISPEDIYNHSTHKHISERFLHLPANKTLALIYTLIDTTGTQNKNNFIISNASQYLIQSVRYLLLRLGILSSGNKNTVYLSKFDMKSNTDCFKYNGALWCRISSIEETNHNDYVYDFNMKDNHNYLTEMGLVHNSGRRNGSIAMYLEPWHADIEQFLELRKNHGNEEERCRDLFTALWIPNLFMKTVQENGDWYLMCPDECPGLCDTTDAAFENLYNEYVASGKFKKKIKAQQLWMSIIKAQIETGTPYILFKDHANNKSNQSNQGVIKSSNLCSEIIQYSDHGSYASCNLASISLPAFVVVNEDGTMSFNFEELQKTAQIVTRNINKIIDRTFYPVKETERNNKLHRPLGIGVTGLADVYAMMRYPFDSQEAAKLNVEIFEAIYYGAVTASMLISKRRTELREELDSPTTTEERGKVIKEYLAMLPEEEELTEYPGSYASFKGSPAEKGLLQYDLWGHTPSSRFDWITLKNNIKLYGLRNSLLTTCMPSASTSQLIGNNESIEPITSNVYVRETLAGNFNIINKYLVADLIKLGLWNDTMKNNILAGGGSIQHIAEIPDDIKTLYKTSWELKMKVLIDQSADRGPFICQSQSLNLFIEDPDVSRISNAHFYSFKRGLKTACYYLRTRPKVKMNAYTLDSAATANTTADAHAEAVLACRRENPEACLMCSA